MNGKIAVPSGLWSRMEAGINILADLINQIIVRVIPTELESSTIVNYYWENEIL